MDRYEAALKLLLEALKANVSSTEVKEDGFQVPVGVSNRHLHLSQSDLDKLFGQGYQLKKLKDLSQPGQYACQETVTICGPGGAIEKVRVLGPVRGKTQVEVMAGDCFKLGVTAPTRLSGDIKDTPGITLIGAKGSVQLTEGLIVAQRHIHMTPEDAQFFGVNDGQVVSVQMNGPRGGIYNNVFIRVTDASALECHIDLEEANAMSINGATKVKILK